MTDSHKSTRRDRCDCIECAWRVHACGEVSEEETDLPADATWRCHGHCEVRGAEDGEVVEGGGRFGALLLT